MIASGQARGFPDGTSEVACAGVSTRDSANVIAFGFLWEAG